MILLEALGHGQPRGWLEIRMIDGAGEVRQSWYPTLGAMLKAWPAMENANRAGWNVYFGICPRSKQSGKKEAVGFIPALWADLDGKDFAEDWRAGKSLAFDVIAELPHHLQPSALVDSGHGLQAYWILREPLPATPDNVTAVEATNAALAEYLGGDDVGNVDRIFRLPGLLNVKPEYSEPAPCDLAGAVEDQRYSLSDFAWLLTPSQHVDGKQAPNGAGLRPGEDFNARGDWSELLTKHGWKKAGREKKAAALWTRPNKAGGISARLNNNGDGLLRVYSSNAAPLLPNTSYSLFGAYAALEHGGDFREATKALAALGYGPASENNSGKPAVAVAVHSEPAPAHRNGTGPKPAIYQPPARKVIWSTHELLSTEFPEPKWAVPGIVPVGLSNLAGRPKLGKSWLGMQIAIAVGTGGKVFDIDIERGPVLYLALEDSERRLQERTRKQGITPNAAITWATEWATMPDGGADNLLRAIEAGGYRLVVIDTLSRFVGRSDQQDLAAMTVLLGNLQRLAQTLEVAVLMIDHHRKANALGADVIDDVMGSTGKAAVADAILGLYKQQGRKGAQLAITGRDVQDRTLALEFDPLTCCWQCLGDEEDVRRDTVKSGIVTAIEQLTDLGELATTTAIADLLGKKKQNVYSELVDLVTKGLVVKAPKTGKLQPYLLPGDSIIPDDEDPEELEEAFRAELWG